MNFTFIDSHITSQVHTVYQEKLQRQIAEDWVVACMWWNGNPHDLETMGIVLYYEFPVNFR